jgi:hypothetical protein
MFKKDNLTYGIVLGFASPILGLLLLKFKRYGMLSFKEVLQYIYLQPDHSIITAGLSVSLMANALLFTIYINRNVDHTAKGIFISTLIYGLIILGVKFLG